MKYELFKLSDEEKQKSRDLFKQWTISNAIAEYIHTTSIFADRFYSHILVIEWLLNGENFDALIKKERDFHRLTSLNDKLKKIRKQSGIFSGMYDYISSLNKARHCIVHNAGYVANQHLNRHDSLELKWKRMAIILTSPDGESVEIDKPMHVAEGGSLGIRFVETSLIFKQGESINITLKDLHDLLGFAQIDIGSMRQSFDAFLDRLAGEKGIEKEKRSDGRYYWPFAEIRRSDMV